ncbi:MAG: M56 family metallopeptidase [Bacillota bacterium]
MTLGILWASGGFVLRVMCGVSVVWLAAAVGGLLLRRSSAALRHRIWAMSTVAVLGMPAAVLLLPEWRVGTINLSIPTEAVPAVEMPPHDRFAATVTTRTHRTVQRPGSELDRGPSEALVASSAEPLRQGSDRVDLAINWRKWLGVIWLMPACWLLLLQGIASLAAQSLLRRGKVIEAGPLATCLSQRVDRLGITARPQLLQSSEIAVPVCMGWIRPRILLPENACTWPSEQLEAVLTHEMAHILRRDVLWQLLGRLACAIYWPHPLAWIASWRMRVERELACDDWVLRGGQPCTRYARWLLDVATMLSVRRHAVESVGVAMAARTGFEKRISAILDPRRRRLPVSRSMAISLTIAAAALLITIASLNPLAPKPANAQSAQGQSKGIATTKPDTPSQKVVRISGRVEDEQGKAVGDVLVESSSGSNRYSTRTTSDGHFALDMPEKEARYAMVWARTREGSKQAFVSLESMNRDRLRDVCPILRPAREFAVTVSDDRGQPVVGAWVAAIGRYAKVGEATTDVAGKAILRTPADAPLEYVAAGKPDTGLDYFAFWGKDQAQTDPYRLAPDYSGPLSFVLNGIITVKVRVIDEQQRPLQGVRVYPWLFEKPKKGDYLNSSGALGLLRLTDAQGIAEFMIPADNTRQINFWTHLDGYCSPKRWIWNPKFPTMEVEAQLLRQIRVTGRVVDSSGRPVDGAAIRVFGDGYQFDEFTGTEESAEDGRFTINVNPEMYYMFVASKGAMVSRAHLQVLRKEAPAPLDLILEPAMRVYGRVTGGPNTTPIPKAPVTLIQQDYESYYKLPKEQQFPGGTVGRKAIVPSVFQHAETDNQGLFEFYVVPGDCEYGVETYRGGEQQTTRFKLPDAHQYVLYHYPNEMRSSRTEETRMITDGKGVEINLHLTEVKPKPDTLKGRVVLRDSSNTPVPEATLSGNPVGHERFFVEGASDRQGNFTVRRGKSDLYLYATTPDKKLQGILLVKPTDDNVTLPIGPTASARGRLLDENGKVLADRQIDFGLRIAHPGGAFSTSFGGHTRTSDDGSFVIEGLVPGFEYSLNVVMEVRDDGHPRSWRTAGKTKADRPERLELGDLKLPVPYRPRQ